MTQYRVQFVDHAGRGFDAVVIERDTDAAAIEEAHGLDVLSIGAGFEVWDQHRLVHKHYRSTYRIYFRNQLRLVIGRDDFVSKDDECAMAIARTLANACSDLCSSFELWQDRRRIDTPIASEIIANIETTSANIQNSVLERELVIRESKWAIAESKRLLQETRRLIERLPIA